MRPAALICDGDGYVGALEGLREAYAALSRGEIRSGGFDLNGLWSPWYTLRIPPVFEVRTIKR